MTSNPRDEQVASALGAYGRCKGMDYGCRNNGRAPHRCPYWLQIGGAHEPQPESCTCCAKCEALCAGLRGNLTRVLGGPR